MSEPLDRFTFAAKPENRLRGTIAALAIVPIGIVAWVALWRFGFIASAVALIIALGAYAFYRFGSGGRIGWGGAIRILLIAVVTIALAFLAGLLSDILPLWTQLTSSSVAESLVDPQFWNVFTSSAADPRNGVLVNGLATVLLGGIGCFWVVRTAFADARAQKNLDVVLPHPDDPPAGS